MTRTYVSPPARPADRGRAFGATHAVEIRRTLELYERLFAKSAGQPLDLAVLGRSALDRIHGFTPDLGDEIEGLAAGAGLRAESVAALNARTELLACGDALGRGECSVVVGLGGAEPTAIQTWDWHEEFERSWLVWTINHPDGRVVHTLTEYGIVGKIGVSSAQIGVLLNILHHERDGGYVGVPVHVLSRRILDEAVSITDALEFIGASEVSASSALTIVACGNGEHTALTAEVYPGGPAYVLPAANGLLVHTNHFRSHPALLGDREATVGPDTYVRYEILSRAFNEDGAVRQDDVLARMASHLGAGGAVCCHPDPAAPFGARWKTLATIALDVRNASLAVLDRGPCNLGAAEWASARSGMQRGEEDVNAVAQADRQSRHPV